MVRIGRVSIPDDGGGGARELLPSPDELVEAARQDGDWIPETPEGKRMLRVLIADDNRDAANSMASLVNMWHHDGRVAYDGAAALEMASVCRPDVLLLDLAMPKMAGWQVARQLRRQSRFKRTLLIAITGYTDHVHRRLCDEAGFDHYLIKPIDLSRLQTLLLRERGRRSRSAAETEMTTGTGWNDDSRSE
jgi:CheY-like chemotaxis protein